MHVKVSGSERYPDEVEAAVYFCCLEAMQNVAKHAPGSTRIWVVLELGSDLRFEVRDDGPGFDVETTQRRGLDNMRDRVAALGGRFEVVSATGGGTRIRGWLPSAPRVRTPQPPQGGRVRTPACGRVPRRLTPSTARVVAAFSSTETSTTTTSGCRSRMRRAVASPSMSGMRTSRRTSAGCSSSTAPSAS